MMANNQENREELTSIFRLRATGVSYEADMAAPKVILNARGYRALKMIHIARENGIPVVSNPDLSFKLSLVPDGFEIPFPLYEAMARLLIELGKAG